MAKRRRLTDAEIAALTPGGEPAPETKSMPRYPLGVAPAGRPPIAQVAGEAAAQAALDEVAGELKAAREEGRLVLELPLETVEAAHLLRDRMMMEPGDMAALRDSLAARGQQAPIEVVELFEGRYGLISGLRRLTALRTLHEETGEARFARVRALLRRPETAAESYRAMVEENEIRADLSFYERARIAVTSARQGVFEDPETAVQSLFSASRAPKRSKILSFTLLVHHFDDVLRHPAQIPEKLGLALVAAIQREPGFADELHAALAANSRSKRTSDAATERAILESALARGRGQGAAPVRRAEVAPGIALQSGRGRLTLSGAGVDAKLAEELGAWLAARAREAR